MSPRAALRGGLDAGGLLAVAIASWWLHRSWPTVPLPTQTLLLGYSCGAVSRHFMPRSPWRPAATVPLSIGMVLLGAQVDRTSLAAIGGGGLLLWGLYQPVVGIAVRTALHLVGMPPGTASLVALGLGGGSLAAVLAACGATRRHDETARSQAIVTTLAVGAIAFLIMPPLLRCFGMDANGCARWVGLSMPTTADAVLVGAAHSPSALRATGAMRFLVNLLLWIPLLMHLRRVDAFALASGRAAQAWLAVCRVPGFVYGLAIMAAVTMLGGLTEAEREALARATNWAFLMVLAGIGAALRLEALRAIGARCLLAAGLGWATAAAILLAAVLWLG